MASMSALELKKDVIKVIAIQSQLIGVDSDNPRPQMRKNLDKMIELIDSANGFIPGKQDLLCFHEQPIMGWQPVGPRGSAQGLY